MKIFYDKVKAFPFILIISLFSLFVSTESKAHTVVLSTYKLKYEDHAWKLFFSQKTRPLRDAIYASNPELKGINLNSLKFLEETSRHIKGNFVLENEGTLLNLKAERLQFDGLQFEGKFTIENLDELPEFLSIRNTGFDTHKHSVKVVSIASQGQEYIHNFNLTQKEAVFSFETNEFISPEGKPLKSFKWYFIVVGSFLILIILRLMLSRINKRKLSFA
ncbi:hypothetical protein BC781_101380 [Sediminitomix flava]|uniref:Uncharacterized protein n=2 Tax=Sediminitomix flava TaxID=379075 RepID=A0A315ZFW9_SEDFL|nr:hypothetical protein BC781_101380 [Sediminitomix flava]